MSALGIHQRYNAAKLDQVIIIACTRPVKSAMGHIAAATLADVQLRKLL
jgi:hypothetical protein